MPEVKVEHIQSSNGTVEIMVRKDWTGQPPKRIYTVKLTGKKVSHGEQFLTEERCKAFVSGAAIALITVCVDFNVHHEGE